MKQARLVINILILVLVPIIANRQRIMNYLSDKGTEINDSPAVKSIKSTSAKTIEGAKHVGSGVYHSTKDTLSNVGEKASEVPNIFKSKDNTVEEINKIEVNHEKGIDAKMLENIAKLNEEKVSSHSHYGEDYASGSLHEKHKQLLDSAREVDEQKQSDSEHVQASSDTVSLFNKHRELHEEQVTKIGRKTGY